MAPFHKGALETFAWTMRRIMQRFMNKIRRVVDGNYFARCKSVSIRVLVGILIIVLVFLIGKILFRRETQLGNTGDDVPPTLPPGGLR